MKNALALAALVALVTSPATAACYGGPAFQTCNDQYVNSDSSAGITTMRGYNAQSTNQWNETVTRSGGMTNPNRMTRRGSWNTPQNGYHNTRTDKRTNSRDRSFFYTCTPYGGCR